MKVKINAYKYWHGPFNTHNIIPYLKKSKNVQGWHYIRNYTFEWLQYAINLCIIIHSDYGVKREFAHRDNVQKYMRK